MADVTIKMKFVNKPTIIQAVGLYLLKLSARLIGYEVQSG